MTAVAERDPAMMPTIVRRVGPEAIEVMERIVDGPDGHQRALCVFWSVEHARRDMYANRCYPEDGWRAIERNREELALVFDLLSRFDVEGPHLVFIEPATGAPELSAVLDPREFLAMLETNAGESR